MTKHAKPFAFAGLDDFIEVFRSGTHTSSTGETRTWTDAELDQMVANHSAEQAAPAVLGHPKDDDPALGWIEQLKRVGNTLLAKFKDVDPTFAEAVRARRFPNRSIKVLATDKGFAIGHVGFLGAALPAVKGLKPISFATDLPSDSYEFALPTQEPPVSFTQAQLDEAVTAATTKAKAEAETAAKIQRDADAAELKKLQFTQRIGECKTIVQGFATRGQDVHLTPAQCEGLAEFRAQLVTSEAQEFTFTAEDKSEKKLTLVACFDNLLKGLPVQMKLGQKQAETDPAKPGASTPEALADKALQFQQEQAAKGVVINIAQAVAHVSTKA